MTACMRKVLSQKRSGGDGKVTHAVACRGRAVGLTVKTVTDPGLYHSLVGLLLLTSEF